MGVKAVIFKEEMSRYIFNMSAGVFGRIVALGAGAGLAVWLLGYAINRFMMVPFFCGGEAATNLCLNSTVISSNIAAVLVGIMIVPVFAMISMKRSLLVVIAAMIALWSVAAWLGGSWYSSLLWTVFAYMAVFASISWINRLRGDLAAIVFRTIFVVLARLAVSL